MKTVIVRKPWGSFTEFTHNEPSTVKLLYVNQGEEFSLQYHHNRREFWKVVKGRPRITIGEEAKDAQEGDEFEINQETKHRIAAPTDDVIVLEISTGEFDEEDIVRVEDKYGRT